ncbi:type II secretion system F family protein [Aeoliella sp. SH292]|uniref:type II secretion system F family protein n=1 Tax=Aeoliella sp. SH292 TaxID=3454464 RepID=UPI003F9C0C88
MQSITPTLLSVLTFIAVVAGIYGCMGVGRSYRGCVRRRVEAIGSAGSTALDVDATPRMATEVHGILQRLGLYGGDRRSGLMYRLAEAGIYSPGAHYKYLLAKVVCGTAFALVGVLLYITGLLPLHLALSAGCLFACVGMMLPYMWLERAITRHRRELQYSLPDFLDIMTICLEAGLSLQDTLRRVGEELRLAHPTLANELRIVQRDIELGATVDQALKRFATRSRCDGIRTLSAFIREAGRFGTNIAEALRGHADMLRTQREQAAEENAQKASVKILLPTLLLIFPAIFVVLVFPAIIQIQVAFASP